MLFDRPPSAENRRENLTPLTPDEIIRSAIPEKDILNKGVCFKLRAPEVSVDTIIIHSCFVVEGILHPSLPVPQLINEASAEKAVRTWSEMKDRESAESDTSAKQALAENAAQWEFAALHQIIASRNGPEALTPYSAMAIKDIFQFYGLSAHYVIDRAGAIFEFVPPELIAFHAGKSQMPRESDRREGVNAFSIGIELLGDLESGFTAEQYASVSRLTRYLMEKFPIANIYGHSDIAPGRKTDPEKFDWSQFRKTLALLPAYQSPIHIHE